MVTQKEIDEAKMRFQLEGGKIDKIEMGKRIELDKDWALWHSKCNLRRSRKDNAFTQDRK